MVDFSREGRSFPRVTGAATGDARTGGSFLDMKKHVLRVTGGHLNKPLVLTIVLMITLMNPLLGLGVVDWLLLIHHGDVL